MGLPRRLARGTSAMVAAAIFGASAPAWATPGEWAVEEAVEVTESRCVKPGELHASVALWLGREAIDRRLRVVVEGEGREGLRFVVFREGEAVAERRFEAKRRVPCADLRAALALAIALSIDATVLKAIEAPPPPPPQPAAIEVPPMPPVDRSPSPPQPPAGTPLGLRVEGHALGVMGVLPAPALGGSLALALIPLPSLSLRASLWATSEPRFALAEGAARVSMAAGQGEGCAEGTSFRACLGGALGRWSARGEGFSVNHAIDLPWVALAAGVEGTVAISRGLRASAGLTSYLPLLAPALQTRDEAGRVVAVGKAPSAGLALRLGVEVDSL